MHVVAEKRRVDRSVVENVRGPLTTTRVRFGFAFLTCIPRAR